MNLIKNFKFYSKLLSINESYTPMELRKFRNELQKFCQENGGDFEEACKIINIPSRDSSGLSKEQEDALDKATSNSWNFDGGKINIENYFSLDGNYTSQKEALKVLFPDGKLIPEITFGVAKGRFIIENYPIVSLDRFPTEINGRFEIIGNSSALDSLVGSPRIVRGNYKIQGSRITNLEGCPDLITGDFELSNHRSLVSLKGSENCDVQGYNFDISRCGLTTLNDGPKSCNSTVFNCEENNLKTLEGAPAAGKSSGYRVKCNRNEELYSLEGLPLDKKCYVEAKGCLFPQSVLQKVYGDAIKFNSWTAAYFYMVTDKMFSKGWSKAQKDPIRKEISAEKIKSKSFALSSIWKDPIMQHPTVQKFMKKIQLTDEEISDTEMMSDFEDLGIY